VILKEIIPSNGTPSLISNKRHSTNKKKSHLNINCSNGFFVLKKRFNYFFSPQATFPKNPDIGYVMT